MAPLLTITIQALLGSVGLKHTTQTPTQIPSKPCHQPVKALGPVRGTYSLSAISWGLNRMDVYGRDDKNGTISHKWWDGSQWGPSWDSMEDLGGAAAAAAAPVAVSWGENHMDVFTRGFDGDLGHKYWDGTAWLPSETSIESLGGSLDVTHTSLAATSWGPNRLDVFAIGADDATLQHKYWDGSQWNPSEGLESLGGRLHAGVSAVSWNTSRLDVFVLDESESLLHLYYDGTTWSNWEDMRAPVSLSQPTVTSWGDNRLDVFGVSYDEGALWHTAWDGSQWLSWENLGGMDLIGPVAATNWAINRTDVVALGTDGAYYYKYWDGHQWNPTDNTLYPKGGNFLSLPTLVSWGENRLDIYGVTEASQLGHQTWYGSGWYPEWGFENLGGELAVDSVDGKVHKEL